MTTADTINWSCNGQIFYQNHPCFQNKRILGLTTPSRTVWAIKAKKQNRTVRLKNLTQTSRYWAEHRSAATVSVFPSKSRDDIYCWERQWGNQDVALNSTWELPPGGKVEAELRGKLFSCFKNFFWIPWGVSGSQHASSWKVHTLSALLCYKLPLLIGQIKDLPLPYSVVLLEHPS